MTAMSAVTAFATSSWSSTKLRGDGVVAVDCDPPWARLTLSHHWDGNATPAEFRHDLATGAALRWAESPDRAGYLRGATRVYNDHYDVDGVLAAWVVLNPDEALTTHKLLLEAAASGDFGEWTSEKGVQFALLGAWLEEPRDSEIARRAADADGHVSTEALYQSVLSELPEILNHPERYDSIWRRAYDDLRRQIALFDSGKVTIEARPSTHLQVLHAPRMLRWRAALARTQADRLLQVVPAGDGFLYEFRYRPCLGYRLVSRELTPVHDVAEIASALNVKWPTEGERWKASGWWSRRLRLIARSEGGRGIPRTPPEIALPVVERVLATLDRGNPRARDDT